ncbi:alkyl hydroperoxide reductase subunit F, partial [Vibrio vulnificus]
MLDQAIKQQLTQYLTNLKQDVRLVVSLDDSKGSQDILALANEIAELSPLISVVRDDKA